jgi:hypothetical protein
VPSIVALTLKTFTSLECQVGAIVGVSNAACVRLVSDLINPTTIKTRRLGEGRPIDLTRVIFIAPSKEEIFFRGFLFFLFQFGAKKLLSKPNKTLFLGLTRAECASIGITAALFGAAHYLNYSRPTMDEFFRPSSFLTHGHFQALAATITGIFYGVLRSQFHLASSISAHTAYNAIALL